MLTSYNQIKGLYKSLEVSFEKDDVSIQVSLWLLKLEIIKLHNDYTLEVEEFLSFDNDYKKLRMGRRNESEEQVNWYKDWREDIIQVVEMI